MPNEDKARILRSLLFPLLFISLLWLVKGVDYFFELDLNRFGLYPLQIKGLPGILTSPFLHADLAHLFANTLPLFILSAFLFYFYHDIAWMILLLIYIITGAWVWVFARGGGVHIGASGVIYGLAAFLFFSGIIRRERGLMVITLMVAFLYGSLIWGIFPELFPNQPISWESHLMGLLSGTLMAIYFRKRGPQQKQWEWEEDDDDDNDPKGGSGDETARKYWQEPTTSWPQPEVRNHPSEQ